MPFAFPTISGGGGSGGGSTYPTHRRGYTAPDVHHRFPVPVISPPLHRPMPSLPRVGRWGLPPPRPAIVPPIFHLPPIVPIVQTPAPAPTPAPSAAPTSSGGGGLAMALAALAPLLVAFLIGRR